MKPVDLPSHVEHGTGNAYSHFACRCALCRKFQSDRSRSYRDRNVELLRERSRAKYRRDPEKAMAMMRKRVARNRAVLSRYKVLKGCFKCGYSDHAVALDFHHRDPALKKLNVSKSMGYAWAAIKEEVAKCEVICRNCHNVLHYGDST